MADGDVQARAVLTPHPGEMRRLASLLPRAEAGAWAGDRTGQAIPSEGRAERDEGRRVAAARAFGQVIVLKGHRTVVTDGERVYVNTTGDSTLAKAGTGGYFERRVGGALAQGMERFEAATLAVWLHGRAGELAGEKYGKRSAWGGRLLFQRPPRRSRRAKAWRVCFTTRLHLAPPKAVC